MEQPWLLWWQCLILLITLWVVAGVRNGIQPKLFHCSRKSLNLHTVTNGESVTVKSLFSLLAHSLSAQLRNFCMFRGRCVTCCGRTLMIEPAGVCLHAEPATRSDRTFLRRSTILTSWNWFAVHISLSWRYVQSAVVETQISNVERNIKHYYHTLSLYVNLVFLINYKTS